MNNKKINHIIDTIQELLNNKQYILKEELISFLIDNGLINSSDEFEIIINEIINNNNNKIKKVYLDEYDIITSYETFKEAFIIEYPKNTAPLLSQEELDSLLNEI